MPEYPESWNVEFAPSPPPRDADTAHKTVILRKGSVFPPAAQALACDIAWERNIPITLRNGTTMYADVLLPADHSGNMPAIVAWSPYGKSLPARRIMLGVSPNAVTGLMKDEGPDAGFWCLNGYAVVHPNPRGVGASEGNIHFWGGVDANDGYDAIEWTAGQDWSNGKVGLHGTSWLAMTQWFIAATNPPHLAAIAPWNGTYDPSARICFPAESPSRLSAIRSIDLVCGKEPDGAARYGFSETSTDQRLLARQSGKGRGDYCSSLCGR